MIMILILIYLSLQLLYWICIEIFVFSKYNWDFIVGASVYFKWYDFWVGTFVDVPGKKTYFQLLPMIGIKLEYSEEDD